MEATLTFRENGTGVRPEGAVKKVAILGFCTIGTTGTAYSYSQASAAEVAAQNGRGKASQLAASILSTEGHGQVVVIPLASTAGTLSAVTSAGTTPPTLATTSSAPDDDFVVRVEMLTPGARGTATFRYCVDYDAAAGTGTWSNPILTAATYTIPDSGIVLNFPVGTYAADNVYSFTTIAPTHSDVQITDGITALRTAGIDVDWIYVCSPAQGATDANRVTALATTFAAVGAAVDAYAATYFKYVGCTIEAGAPVASDTSGLATWRTAHSGSASVQAFASNRMTIGAGQSYKTSDLDGRVYRRNAGWSALERISQTPPSEMLGKTKTGKLRGISKLEHNEGVIGGLADGTAGQRFLTLRTYEGFAGYYVHETHTWAVPGSDYSKIERLRVVNEGARAARSKLLEYLGDDAILDSTTGLIIESAAQGIDSELLYALAAAVSAYSSSVGAKVNRAQNILATGILKGEFAIQPKGYFRSIQFSIGLTRTTTPAS